MFVVNIIIYKYICFIALWCTPSIFLRRILYPYTIYFLDGRMTCFVEQNVSGSETCHFQIESLIAIEQSATFPFLSAVPPPTNLERQRNILKQSLQSKCNVSKRKNKDNLWLYTTEILELFVIQLCVIEAVSQCL